MLILQSLGVLPGESGARLDRFLRDRFPGVPSRSVRFAIEGGAVRVGGASSPKGRILREGEIVTVASLAEGKDWLPVPSDLPGASVVYEDSHVAVLCKPQDVHTEPQRPLEAGTLAGYLRMLHPEVTEISPAPGLTLLTRLDFATSGAVPAALTAQAWTFLRHEREMGAIGKRYLCLVEGDVPEPITIGYAIDSGGGGGGRPGAAGFGGPGPMPVDLDRAGRERGEGPHPGPGDDLPRQAAPDPGAPRRGRPSDRGRPPVRRRPPGGTGEGAADAARGGGDVPAPRDGGAVAGRLPPRP